MAKLLFEYETIDDVLHYLIFMVLRIQLLFGDDVDTLIELWDLFRLDEFESYFVVYFLILRIQMVSTLFMFPSVDKKKHVKFM